MKRSCYYRKDILYTRDSFFTGSQGKKKKIQDWYPSYPVNLKSLFKSPKGSAFFSEKTFLVAVFLLAVLNLLFVKCYALYLIILQVILSHQNKKQANSYLPLTKLHDFKIYICLSLFNPYSSRW